MLFCAESPVNAVVCDIYVVKLLFRDTLPRRNFEIQAG